VQNTHSQDNFPEIGNKSADKANREGGADRFDEAAGHQTIEVDLARITSYDELRKDLELSLWTPAKQPDPHTRYLLQTVPGIGTSLRLVLLYEIHDIHRFPSGQDFASYCRLGTCSNASAGKRLGTSGRNLGNAHLQWAVSEAATVLLRNNLRGQKLRTRLENKHDTGKALRMRAHQLARAVSDMLKRKTAFDMESLLQPCVREQRGRSRRRPGHARDEPHSSTLCMSTLTASVTAQACRGPVSLSPPRCLDTRSGS
jgi:transposase